MITPTSKLPQHEIDGFNRRLALIYERYYANGIDVTDPAAECSAWSWLMSDWLREFARVVEESEPNFVSSPANRARFSLWIAQQMVVYRAMETEYRKADKRRESVPAYMLKPVDDDTRQLLELAREAARVWEARKAHG